METIFRLNLPLNKCSRIKWWDLRRRKSQKMDRGWL